MSQYKGITFAEGYDKPFANFKKEFGSTHIFKSIPPEELDSEFKKAYKIATNGRFSGSTKKSSKGKSGKA